MTIPPGGLRLLRFLVVVELVLASAAAATVHGSGGAPSTPSAATTSTTAVAVLAPPATTTTVKRVLAAPTTTQPAARALKPAAAGGYDYLRKTTEDQEDHSSQGGFTLSEAKESEGEIRQIEVAIEEDTSATTSYAWRADGLYARSHSESTFGDSSAHTSCDYQPDLLLVASPLGVGRQWSFSSTCEGATFSGTSRVLRFQHITVANKPVEVYAIQTTGRVPYNGFPSDFVSTQFYSWDRGLVLREDTLYSYAVADHHTQGHETVDVLNLEPKKQ